MTTTRRFPGDGSIYRRSVDGRWFGAVDVRTVDGRRRRLTVSASTRKIADRRLADLQHKLATIRARPTRDRSVGRFLVRWVDHVLPATVASPNTLDNYRWAVHKHLVPGFGHLPLDALSPGDVAALLQTKLEAGLSARTVARLRTTLGLALRHAIVEGLVDANAALLTRGPRRPIREGRSLTLDQARALRDASRGDRLEVAFTLMLSLGLRPGEVLELRWRDVDFDTGTLDVRRSLKRERDGLRIGTLKTPRSRRTLALPAAATAGLRSQRARQARERLAAGHDWHELDLVFAGAAGHPVDPGVLLGHLRAITKRIGLGRWHPHELRHSAVSLLSAAGLRLEDVADVMGHRSTRTTFAVYRHVTTPTIDVAVDTMDRLFPA